MIEAQDNFKSKPTNIAYLNNATAKTKPSLPRFNDIIESSKQQEDSIMPQETYTKSEIDLKFEKLSTDIHHGFEKVDLKFENIQQRMDDGFKQVDLKFEQVNQKLDYSINHILSETRNLLLEQQVKEKAEREQERKATNRWLVGIAISLAGLIISIIVNFFLKK
ncbi:hypothetical protein [Streptococcus suis]|uniref:hypothetical protein n=1 Tax=Streptococcus suis TaxID=1307 RepID=UPI002FC90568